MKDKILEIYKNGEKVQTVNFQKGNDAVGWMAVNFDRDKYLPFYMHDSMEQIKAKLLEQGFTWEWKNTNWLFWGEIDVRSKIEIKANNILNFWYNSPP